MNKHIALFAMVSSLFFLNACGDDDSTAASQPEVSAVVDSFDNLEKCEKKIAGELVYVREDYTTYSCENGKWKVYKSYDTPLSISEESDEKPSCSSEKKSSSSSARSSSSLSASKEKNSSSSKKKSSSSQAKSSSSSEETTASSSEESSSSIASSSSVFVCSNNNYCQRIKETCDEALLDSVKEVEANGSAFYFYCDTNGWQPLTYEEYDTFGKKCKFDGDTLWGIHDYSSENLTTHRYLYSCKDGKPTSVSNYLKSIYYECNDFTQNMVVQKKYSSFVCHGRSWYLRNQVTGTMVDPRDGREYRTVGIGDHMWMQEDLAYNTNNTANLYTWTQAMGGLPDSLDEGDYLNSYIQGICPDGWRVMSYSDARELSDYFRALSNGGYQFEEKCYVGKTGWKYDDRTYPEFFKGPDCMNTDFTAKNISITTITSKENDKGHVAGLWISGAKPKKGAALIIENAVYTGQISYSFSKSAYYDFSSYLSIRCVKNEEREIVYKTAKDAPIYTTHR